MMRKIVLGISFFMVFTLVPYISAPDIFGQGCSETICATEPSFDGRQFLLVPYVVSTQCLSLYISDTSSFDCDKVIFNIAHLMEMVGGGDDDDSGSLDIWQQRFKDFIWPGPSPAFASSGYDCSFDTVGNETTFLRIPMSEGCRVLVDQTEYHTLEIKSVSTGLVVHYESVFGLGRGSDD